MPAPIFMDFRLRIVRAVEHGSSMRETARRFAVSPSAAIELMQRCASPAAPHPTAMAGIAARSSSRMRRTASLRHPCRPLDHPLRAPPDRAEAQKNVWPAPSARECLSSAERSASTYSAAWRCRGQDGDPRGPSLPSRPGVACAAFFGQSVEPPVDRQAISCSPPADLRSVWRRPPLWTRLGALQRARRHGTARHA
jgi:hypothetical protein